MTAFLNSPKDDIYLISRCVGEKLTNNGCLKAFTNFPLTMKSPGGLVPTFTLGTDSSQFMIIGLHWGLRIYISYKFLGNAATDALGHHLESL